MVAVNNNWAYTTVSGAATSFTVDFDSLYYPLSDPYWSDKNGLYVSVIVAYADGNQYEKDHYVPLESAQAATYYDAYITLDYSAQSYTDYWYRAYVNLIDLTNCTIISSSWTWLYYDGTGNRQLLQRG